METKGKVLNHHQQSEQKINEAEKKNQIDFPSDILFMSHDSFGMVFHFFANSL